MNKKQLHVLLLAIPMVLLVILGCSKIQDSTGLGANLVNSERPDLAINDSSFQADQFGIPVESATSTRASSSSVPLGIWHNSYSRMVCGKWNGDSSIGYTRYDTNTILPGSIASYEAGNSITYTIDKIRLCFYAARDNRPYDSTLSFEVSIDRTRADSLSYPFSTNTIVVLDTINFVPNRKDTPTDTDTGYYPDTSIILDTAYYYPVHKGKLPDRHDTLLLGLKGPSFNIVVKPLTSNRILSLEAPRVAVSYHYSTKTIANRDTIIDRTDTLKHRYADYMVLESDSSSLNNVAISSYPAYRRSVIALDLRPFWAAMKKSDSVSFLSIQSARLSIPDFTFKADTMTMDTANMLDVSFSLSKTNIPDTNDMRYTLLLRPSADSTLMLNLRDGLLKLMEAGKPDIAYLTLSFRPLPASGITEKWATVDWGIQSGKRLILFSTFSFPR